jgi:hypothetical protein
LDKWRALEAKRRAASPRGLGYRGRMIQRSHRLRPVPMPEEREIRHAAYLLWEQAGRPAGRDQEFWFTAREILCHALPPARLPRAAATAARNAQSRRGRIR